MNKSIVKFEWNTAEDFAFPQDKQFSCTGYCGKQGVDQTFSIVVRLIDFDGQTKNATHAEVFALSEDMEDNLPKESEQFYFTSGAKVVATGVAALRNF